MNALADAERIRLANVLIDPINLAPEVPVPTEVIIASLVTLADQVVVAAAPDVAPPTVMIATVKKTPGVAIIPPVVMLLNDDIQLESVTNAAPVGLVRLDHLFKEGDAVEFSTGSLKRKVDHRGTLGTSYNARWRVICTSEGGGEVWFNNVEETKLRRLA